MSVDCPTGPVPVLPTLIGSERRERAERGAVSGTTTRTAEFTRFVETRYDHLLRVGSLLAGDRHRGEELLQGALVKTYEAYGRIEDTTRLDAYVRTVMVNAMRSRWRRPWREDPFAEPPEPSHAIDPTTRLATNDQLKRALAQLPPRQRAAVVLRYFDDASEAEVARMLGCSVGTVKSQTSRALTRLRGLVDDDRQEGA